MKTLTKAIFVIAILNLLAVLAGAGWLFSSGRINKARITDATMLFNETIAIEEAKLKAEQAQIDKELAEQVKPLPAIPLNAQERNLVRVEMTQIDRQRLDRMKREVKNLQDTLRRERELLILDRIDLQDEKDEFDAMRDRLAGLEGGKQFKKSLATITGMKSKDAKTILSNLLTDSKKEEVVTYLSSMGDRERTSILTEFVKAGEDQLAADLLESIRLRGLENTPSDKAD